MSRPGNVGWRSVVVSGGLTVMYRCVVSGGLTVMYRCVLAGGQSWSVVVPRLTVGACWLTYLRPGAVSCCVASRTMTLGT